MGKKKMYSNTDELQLSKELQKRMRSLENYQGDLHDPDHLNNIFSPLNYLDRIHLLYAYFHQSEVLLTSSFGTNSAFLLAQIAKMRPTQPVHFIDTGFHFQETLEYRDILSEALNMRVIDVLPDPSDYQQAKESSLWAINADQCCNLNKIRPLEKIKPGFKVWISGLLGFQTNFRSGLKIFERQGNLLKFHPLIDLSEVAFDQAFAKMKLPPHPLAACGYGSVGCTHCTQKGEGRAGRWVEEKKSECGLHPGYFSKKAGSEDKKLK